jgi:DNA-binding response OmpR family regulator
LKKSSSKYTLLYVEDDETVRVATTELFKLFFKEVIVAKDGVEALAVYNSNIHLVISDIEMPNMNGIELSKEILARNPNQKIIIVSAYNETKYFIELIKIGVSGFLQKPLSRAQIYETLGEVFEQLNVQEQGSCFVELPDGFRWNKETKNLYTLENEVDLSSNERALMVLFMENIGQKLTDIDIYNHLYYDDSDKDFSTDAIKSLIKRLRKKIPQGLIKTYKNIGYSFIMTP